MIKNKNKKENDITQEKNIEDIEDIKNIEDDELYKKMYSQLYGEEQVEEKEKDKKEGQKNKKTAKEKKKKTKNNLGKKSIKKDGKKIKAKKVSAEERNTSKIIPIKDEENGVFVLNTGEYMDIVKLQCKDLVSASESEVLYDILTLNKWNRSNTDTYKIIGINFPTNTKTQQNFYLKAINMCHKPQLRNILAEKMNELVNIEKNNTDREYYAFIYGNSYRNVVGNTEECIKSLSSANLCSRLSFAKKLQVLFKMANKNTSVYANEKFFDYQRPYDADEQVEMLGYNPYLLSIIQPQGGVSFKDDDYIRTGDGYECCIRIYMYPSVVDRHWLTYIMNIPLALTTVDVRTLDSAEVKRILGKSITEYKSRAVTAKNFPDFNDADERRKELQRLYEEVNSMGEVIKEIVSRIFISAKSKYELDNKVSKILKYLEGNEYKATVLLNESKYEYESMYLSLDIQETEINKRKAFPVTSSTLSAGDPLHFTSLNDMYGSYYGTTTTSGVVGKVIWDGFASDEIRTSYNGCVFGKMGNGKSTLLKKMMRDRGSRGDFIRCLDLTGEYIVLCKMLGGTVISLDGSDGMINFLQINKLGETESDSFTMHLSKLNTIYKFIAPESSHAERIEFENLVRNLYIDKNIIPADATQIDNYNISGLNAEEYPILSDLLSYMEDNMQNVTNKDTKKYYDNIYRVINNLVQNYGKIFNGHTSLKDVVSEQIVVFNLQNLTSLKSEIFDAQLFSALSLCWSNAVKIGSTMKRLVEEKKIPVSDVKHFLLLLDESHKTINSTKPYAVEQVLVYAREGRKYFAGIYLASQSIRDFVPEGTSAEGFDKIKTLFELAQYKFILNQDTDAVDMLSNIFKGQLTATEIKKIPRLDRGQAILSISGSKNITFKVEVTPEELMMFKGGV